MTHPVAVEELQNEAVAEVYGDEIAEPLLAALQSTFDEAMACLDDLARSWSGDPEPIDPHPRTQKIDVRLIEPPVVADAGTPPTRAMSLAARCMAEHPLNDVMTTSVAGGRSGPEGLAASSPAERGDPATHIRSDPPTAPRRRRRWWQL